MPSFRNLTRGDPAPSFEARSTSNPRYTFDIAAGRYIVLCFFGTAGDAAGRRALELVRSNRALFDDDTISLFGVSNDPTDERQARVAADLPGIRFFWDFDASIARLYGAADLDSAGGNSVALRRLWMILDPTMRILHAIPFREDGGDGEALVAALKALPPVSRFAGVELQAPVLYLPNVFEPDLCERLIGLHRAKGGELSGFMREVDGKTVVVHDPKHKRRTDYTITDPELIDVVRGRVRARIAPEVLKIHQFAVTRMERYLVACYGEDIRGHFRAHRDNTTRGTAHRRFAVSINLNDDFDGGEVGFPEYGPRTFKPPPGGAVVFSCSLLHMVTPVVRGARYAFLPFLYDDEAARLREANNRFLGDDVGSYRAE